MRDIVYVSDFFYPEVKGGAEQYDKVFMDYLGEEGFLKKQIRTENLKKGHVVEHGDDLFVVSNFAKLDSDQQSLLRQDDIDYVIIEHDYKLEHTRQPQRHPDYKIPPECMANIEFYKDADKIVVQSSLQESIFEKNISNLNLHNLSGNLWKPEDLEFLLSLNDGKKEGNAIVDSDNPIKGKELCMRYCEKNDLEYDLVSSDDQKEFWRKLSEYERLIYLPLTPETFGRVAMEALIMGTRVVANEKVGALHEDWVSNQEPEEMVKTLKEKIFELEMVINEV